MRRREFLKIAGAGAAGGVLLPTATIGGVMASSPPSVQAIDTMTGFTFRGRDDHALVTALRYPHVEFRHCKFRDCGLVSLMPGQNFLMHDCHLENTGLSTGVATFDVRRCGFRWTKGGIPGGTIVRLGSPKNYSYLVDCWFGDSETGRPHFFGRSVHLNG